MVTTDSSQFIKADLASPLPLHSANLPSLDRDKWGQQWDGNSVNFDPSSHFSLYPFPLPVSRDLAHPYLFDPQPLNPFCFSSAQLFTVGNGCILQTSSSLGFSEMVSPFLILLLLSGLPFSVLHLLCYSIKVYIQKGHQNHVFSAYQRNTLPLEFIAWLG